MVVYFTISVVSSVHKKLEIVFDSQRTKLTHLLQLCFKETAFLSSIAKYSMNPGTVKHPRYNMSNSQHAMCEFIYRSPWFSKKHSGLAMWIGYMVVTQQASFHKTSFKRHKLPKTECYTRKVKISSGFSLVLNEKKVQKVPFGKY